MTHILPSPHAPPTPVATAPAPTVVDPSIQEAAQAQATALAQAGGRASTILTSGTGTSDPLDVQTKALMPKTLLGA